MKERPILFSAPMVRALLDGAKTQTRRVVKPQPDSISPDGMPARFFHQRAIGSGYPVQIRCPYGQPGDRLWVREAWAPKAIDPECTTVAYRATDDECNGPWKPSIHMHRWASRIDLEVTGVRVERLQDISQSDARAEGAPPSHPSIDRVSREFGYADFPRSWYAQLWEQINGAGSWDANPWVWAVSFRRIRP